MAFAGRPSSCAHVAGVALLVLDGELVGEQDAGRGRGGNRALALELMEDPMGAAHG